MGTSYRLTIAFVGTTLVSGAFACPVAMVAANATVESPALTLSSGAFACPVGLVAAAYVAPTPPPTWLVGAAVNQWIEISGTNSSGASLDAWGTLVPVGSLLVSPANGGHGDSSDNRVSSVDLSQDAPSWTQQIAPSSSVQVDVEYYADGKPTSRHGYAYAHYISQRSRVMMFGARGMYGNGNDGLKVASHTVSGTWAWDAEGTFTASPSGRGTAMDPTTGNVITNSGRLWTESTGAWSTLGAFSGGWRYPLAYDSSRAQFFALQWGDGGPDSGSSGTFAQKFSATTGAGTTITINSSAAYTQWQADSPRYAGMDYDAANDRFLFYAGQTFSGGSVASNVPGRTYVITPNSGSTWDMSELTTSGTPANPPSGGAGVNGRWKYLTIGSVSGFVLAPTQSTNIWFLRTA